MISLNTSMSDLNLQQTLLNSTLGLNRSINRLTSGYKLLGAKDNAAGYSIAKDLQKRINSMIQLQQNAADGMDLLNIAESGLSEIVDQLQRLRALAIDASNATYDEKSRAAIQTEAESILDSIRQIKNNTAYDEQNVFQTVTYVDYTSGAAGGGATFGLRSPVILSESDGSQGIGTLSSNPEVVATSAVEGTTSITSENGVNINSPEVMTTNSTLENTPIILSESEGTQEIGTETSNTEESLPIARTMSLRSAAPASTLIEGNANFAGGETKTITIDNIQYVITNKNLTESSAISWSKDITTGELTFVASYFIIEGQDNVSHNIVIKGKFNTVFGGNQNDILRDTNNTDNANLFVGCAGDDTITTYGRQSSALGGDDNDIITAFAEHGKIDAGDGDDILNINASSWGASALGGKGNDTFNINSATYNYYLLGGEGDDTFNFIGAANQTTVDGGSGINTIAGTQHINTKLSNISNATNNNLKLLELNAGETKTLTINNKDYTITNNFNYSYGVLINLNGEVVEFGNFGISETPERGEEYIANQTIPTPEDTLEDFPRSWVKHITIKGADDQNHNVKLISTYISFIGGNLNDTINLAFACQSGYGMGGDDIITLNHDRIEAFGGDGNDTIQINRYDCFAYGGSGDDILKNNSAGRNTVIGGSGSNTLTVTGGSNYTSENATEIILGINETKDVVINGITYTIKNYAKEENALLYQYNSTTNEIIFSGALVDIKGQDNIEHNVQVRGVQVRFAGGNLNDKITSYLYEGRIYGLGGDDTIVSNDMGNVVLLGGSGNDTLSQHGTQSALYGESGNDTLTTSTATSSAIGGDGNDSFYVNAGTITDSGGNNTYYVNANDTNITGGSGNDTFYINSSGNIINGAGGDDHFVIDNTGANTINGGTGTNTAIDNSGGAATLYNISSDPNSGSLSFYSTNETQNLTINGITYSVKNCGADGTTPANNKLYYSYNPTTGELRIEGSNFTITSSNPSKLLVRGDNNLITGTSGADNITIESGSNNIVNGGAGNDILTTETANNSLLGGAGADTITLNASSNKEISGGADNDTIVLNSNNNSNINLTEGTDSISGSGNSNTINLTNGNAIINGSSNNLTTSSNGTISFTGDSNTVTATGSGVNVTLTGNSNSLESSGSGVNVTLSGDSNVLESTGDGATINIDGDNNELNSVGGGTVSVVGESNNITGGAGNDTITNIGANTIITNAGVDSVTDNTSGNFSANLNFTTAGEVNTLTIQGQSFQITNNNTTGVNLKYSYDSATKLVTFEGSNFSIIALNKANFAINGSNNSVTGSGDTDSISIIGGSSNTVDGGAGDDSITLGTSGNTASGGEGADTITSNADSNTLNGGIGNDKLIANGADNILNGEDGNDHLSASNSGNTLNGDDGSDTLNSTSTDNTLNGGAGNDNLTASGSNNILNGEDGDDTLTSNATENTIHAGSGNDIININATTTKDVTGGDGNDRLTINSDGNTNVDLGSGNDSLRGQGNNNVIDLGDGNNSVDFTGNNNTIIGGNGDDRFVIIGNENNILGGDGNNSFNIEGSSNSLVGGAGNDEFRVVGNYNDALGGDGDDEMVIVSGVGNSFDGGSGVNNTTDSGESSILANTRVAVYKPFELKLKIDLGTDENSMLKATLNLGILDFEVDFSTVESSREALDIIDDSLRQLSEQQVQIGSLINRVEYILDAQEIKMNSLVSSLSTIQDADIAEESAKYIRYQILQQASATLLSATRNLRYENVLGLLNGINR